MIMTLPSWCIRRGKDTLTVTQSCLDAVAADPDLPFELKVLCDLKSHLPSP